MKNFFLNSILALCVLLTACTKESREIASNVLSGEETLIAKMNQIKGAQNAITLSSETTGLGHKKKSYQINASIGDSQLDKCDNITLNNNIVLKRYVPTKGLSNQFISNRTIKSEEYGQLFGKKFEFTMNDNAAQALGTRTEQGGSIMTPTEIEVTIPTSNPTSNANTIAVPRNVPLRWNPDPNNSSVYILVLFDPRDVSNFRYSNARRVSAFHTVPDNGSYTIPASDFNGIPVGGHIEILVARGNTALIGATSNGLGSTALMTYSMAILVANSGGGSCGDCIEVYP